MKMDRYKLEFMHGLYPPFKQTAIDWKRLDAKPS